MSGRAIRVVVVAAIAIAIAAMLWSLRKSGPEPAAPEPDQTSNENPKVPIAATTTSERRDWFPDLSDPHSPLTTGAAAQGASGRFDCSYGDIQWGVQDEEERDARNALLADTLSRSANAEDQLAAAMIRPPEVGSRIDNLRMALAADPMHPLVLWQVADDCRRGRGGEYCADPYVRANVEAVLGGNGWYWVQVAAFYHEQGLFDQSLQATRRAVSAPEFDDYFIDNVLLLERALSADSDRNYIDRIAGAIGYSAAMPNEYLARECAQRAEQDGEWLDVCTMLVERYEQDGTNLLMQMMGLELQERFYAQSGLSVEIADARIRRLELRELLDRVDADYQLVQALDPNVNARYLDVWKSSGEVAALEYAIAAVDELLEDSDYDPCVFMPSE